MNRSETKPQCTDEPACAIPCGGTCSATGCWNKCRRPDGHSGEHQCDQHGG